MNYLYLETEDHNEIYKGQDIETKITVAKLKEISRLLRNKSEINFVSMASK